MFKNLGKRYNWHDGFCRFIFAMDRDCAADVFKLVTHCGMRMPPNLLSVVDWERSQPVPASFFDNGGKRIRHADVIYVCYLKNTDYYFYWVIEHKDEPVRSVSPLRQLLGYCVRTSERDRKRGRLVLPLLLTSGGCKVESYTEAVLADLRRHDEALAGVLAQGRTGFMDCQPPVLCMDNVPDEVLLDDEFLRCGGVFYAIKHRQRLDCQRIAILLGLCRAMVAHGKGIVVDGTICYGMEVSGLDYAAWRQIEIDDTPHLLDKERVMHKREFGLTAMMKDFRAEGKAEERSKIALAMLKEGESEAKICRMTGMSRKELQLLRRSLRE